MSSENTMLLAHLRDLVAALDRRVPHLEREGESQIAGDAAILKRQAEERIASLEREANAPEATLSAAPSVEESR